VISTPADGATLTTLTPALGGTAEPGATVTVYDGDTALGTAPASAGGEWTFTPAAPLAAGVHVFTATATDAASNTGPSSAAVTVTLNLPGPAAPVITTPAAGAAVRDTTPRIGGTGPVGSTVRVYEGTRRIATATVRGDGTWAVDSAVLAQGSHTISATATDAAGAVSPPSATVTFVVDTVRPKAPIVTTPRQLTRVRTAAIPVAGTAEAGSTVMIEANGRPVGSATVAANGAWSLTTAPVSNGLVLLTAQAVDAAGNQSAISPVLVVVCDIHAPGGRFSLVYLLLC
jgi:hypothetical protein